MILQSPIASDAGHDALREHIERDLRLDLDGRDPHHEIPELAAALATAWAVDFGRATLPSLVYPLLASRLLCRLGRRPAAERILRRRVGSGGRADLLLRLMERGGPSLRSCTLLADGILRPEASSLCPRGGAWLVDVGRLAGPADAVLELQLLDRLRRVLEVAADLLDADQGAGLVLLAGAHAPGSAGRQGLPGDGELCRFSRDVLGKTARIRKWKHVPGVHLQPRKWPAN
jgi:hypothetical protein